MRNRHPELLIPASSLEVLKTAVMSEERHLDFVQRQRTSLWKT